MENEKIKQILLDIAPTDLDFSVIQTGKSSKRVNGLYSPDTHEILLHNKNFKTDNQLIYTAIHEYTHHLNAEQLYKDTGNFASPYNSKVHTQAFWARFNRLLTIAEEKGFYVIGLENSPELLELTEKIKKDYLEANGKLMQEFGKLLAKAYELCVEANIRYEDYIDRVLCLPRNTAKDIRKVSSVEIDPSIGFENMKFVASVRKKDERAEVEKQFLEGKSSASVREMMKNRATQALQTSPKEKLEKEKHRLEKTIEQLSRRLEFVEESLSHF